MKYLLISLISVFALNISFGCDCIYFGVTYDTLLSGGVESSYIKTFEPYDTKVIDTAYSSELIQTLDSLFQNTKIIFSGTIDSSYQGQELMNADFPIILKNVFPIDSTSINGVWEHVLISIDSIYKGSLPYEKYWIKEYLPGIHSCYYGYRKYKGKTLLHFTDDPAFLNASPTETCGLPGAIEIVDGRVSHFSSLGVSVELSQLGNTSIRNTSQRHFIENSHSIMYDDKKNMIKIKTQCKFYKLNGSLYAK